MTRKQALNHYLQGIHFRRVRFARLCPNCGRPAKEARKDEHCHGYARRSHQNVWVVPLDA